jgi:two-component system, OmpR family, catabolic regulation response regulator CreB
VETVRRFGAGNTRVLVVEDDSAIADAVAYALRKEGMHVEVAETLALARPKLGSIDVVVLDLVLTDGSGFTLLQEIQRQPTPPRVLVLTSRDEEVDCVAALEAGADDFVTKPFSPRALVARVRAVARRGAASGEPVPAMRRPGEGLSIDVAARRVAFGDAEVVLTRIEFDLLQALAATPGRVLTRDQLLEKVWGSDFALTPRTVDSHVKAVRRKLEQAGAPDSLIETVRSVGFRMKEKT